MLGYRLVRLLLAGALAAGAVGALEVNAQPLEAAVKAAFLPKFIPYVTWPAPAVPAAGGSHVICVVGRDPLGALLDEAAGSERLGGVPLVVRRLERINRQSGCDVAFLGGSDDQSVTAALDAINGAPVLTVTDARVSRERGMVHFELKDGRVRFHIDNVAAGRSGLGLSSKLLGLALSVKRGRS